MQSAAAIATADARLRAFADRRVLLAVVILGAGLTAITVALVHMTAFLITAEDATRALDMDFRVFWAAARLALAGEALASFDMARLGAEHGVSPEAWMPWLYPPGYLILIAPFGWMSFAAAFLLSSLVSVALLAWALRPFAAGSRTVWVALILAPAYIPALILGQNSLIWLAGLVAALAALRGQRWILAGIFIGCLTLKPQLGLMIPLALLAAGLWRTILAATVTALLLAALPTLVFGIDYWPLLAERLAEQSGRLLVSIDDLFLIVGPYHLFTMLGLSAQGAITAQGVVTLLSAVLLFLLWRSPRAGFDARAAGLLLAILLSAPYLWYYEAAFMAVIGLFLLRAGVLRARPLHLVLLGLLWFGAALQALNVFLDFTHGRWLGAVIITPILAVSLAVLMRHILAPTRDTPGQPAIS